MDRKGGVSEKGSASILRRKGQDEQGERDTASRTKKGSGRLAGLFNRKKRPNVDARIRSNGK